MELLEQLNAAVGYVEDNLCGDIDIREAANITINTSEPSEITISSNLLVFYPERFTSWPDLYYNSVRNIIIMQKF